MEHVTVVTTLPLWLVGFAVAIYQLTKTRRAADAARAASEAAVREFSNQ
jgi:hypothetical protein